MLIINIANIDNIIIIIITRPKPSYGQQGLAGSWGKDTVRQVHFGMLSTSHFAPRVLNSGVNLGTFHKQKVIRCEVVTIQEVAM